MINKTFLRSAAIMLVTLLLPVPTPTRAQPAPAATAPTVYPMPAVPNPYTTPQPAAGMDSQTGIPHNFIIAADMDGNDVWIGTSKGLAWGQGAGYYPGLRERTPASGKPAAGQPAETKEKKGM